MWITFNPNPCGRNVGDCAVRALCAALDVSWEDAFWMLAESAFEMCDMPSSNAVISAVMRKHGFNRASIPDYCPNCYTASDFCKDHPEGVFSLGFGSHICTVINGNIYDSWDSSNEIPQYYFYRKDG